MRNLLFFSLASIHLTAAFPFAKDHLSGTHSSLLERLHRQSVLHSRDVGSDNIFDIVLQRRGRKGKKNSPSDPPKPLAPISVAPRPQTRPGSRSPERVLPSAPPWHVEPPGLQTPARSSRPRSRSAAIDNSKLPVGALSTTRQASSSSPPPGLLQKPNSGGSLSRSSSIGRPSTSGHRHFTPDTSPERSDDSSPRYNRQATGRAGSGGPSSSTGTTSSGAAGTAKKGPAGDPGFAQWFTDAKAEVDWAKLEHSIRSPRSPSQIGAEAAKKVGIPEKKVAQDLKTKSKNLRAIASEQHKASKEVLKSSIPGSPGCISALRADAQACADAHQATKAYANAEITVAQSLQAKDTWDDIPKHLQSAARAFTQSRIQPLGTQATRTGYQANLEHRIAVNAHADDSKRNQHIKNAVEIKKKYKHDVGFYRGNFQQYKDVRAEFSGASSSDESEESFSDVPKR